MVKHLFHLRTVLLGIALFAVGCSSSNPIDITATETADELSVAESPIDAIDEVPAQSNELVVELRGYVIDQAICPGGTQPCVTLDQTDGIEVGSGGSVVRVQFVDGVATVLQSEPVVFVLDYTTDRCDNTLPQGNFERLAQYTSTIPEAFANVWVSDTGRLHLGVVGEAAPHQDALTELGLSETVCVAGGFPATEAELASLSVEVGDMLDTFAPRADWFAQFSEPFIGAFVVEMHRADESMLNESQDRFGDLVELRASWAVLDGSLEDLDRQLDQLEPNFSAAGFGPATTILDPDYEPDPASTELHLLIMEGSCANGEAPIGRDVLPVVIETDTTVEISTLVAPVAGDALCPSNPWHPVVATLSAPLGNRQVIDTQTSPGVDRNWPPTDQELSG